MNFPINIAASGGVIPLARIGSYADGSVIARMIRLTCLGFILQAGLCSAAVFPETNAPVTQARRHDDSALAVQYRVQRSPVTLASAAQSDQARDDVVDKMRTKEIMGFQDDELRTRKFLQLVILPLGICFALVFLLRRGFLT